MATGTTSFLHKPLRDIRLHRTRIRLSFQHGSRGSFVISMPPVVPNICFDLHGHYYVSARRPETVPCPDHPGTNGSSGPEFSLTDPSTHASRPAHRGPIRGAEKRHVKKRPSDTDRAAFLLRAGTRAPSIFWFDF